MTQKQSKQSFFSAVLLLLMAFGTVAGATWAWFTIADYTKVRAMSMEISTGFNLRFDLKAHKEFEDYVKTLSFGEIVSRMSQEQHFDAEHIPLEPVTTSDYQTFRLENGTAVSSSEGSYWSFTLHFMAQDDMVVHLTSASSRGKADGTAVSSSVSGMEKVLRISFTADGKTYVYSPSMGDTSQKTKNAKLFGLPTGSQMVYNNNNAMFSLKENVDKPVVVHIWLEGTDAACDNSLRGGDFSIALRFLGTDAENQLVGELE